MRTKLTLTIEDHVINSAKKYARRKGGKPIGDSRKLFEIDNNPGRTKCNYISQSAPNDGSNYIARGF